MFVIVDLVLRVSCVRLTTMIVYRLPVRMREHVRYPQHTHPAFLLAYWIYHRILELY